MSNKDTSAPLNPKTAEYEFLGPPGALLVSVSCPLLVFALIFLCNENGCPPLFSSWPQQFPPLREFVDIKAIILYIAFQVALAVLWAVMPGKWVKGRQLRDGTVLEYKLNGISDSQKTKDSVWIIRDFSGSNVGMRMELGNRMFNVLL